MLDRTGDAKTILALEALQDAKVIPQFFYFSWMLTLFCQEAVATKYVVLIFS